MIENTYRAFMAHIQGIAKAEAERATRAVINEIQQKGQDKIYVNERVVANHFNISTQSVARGRKKNEIPFHRIGGRILYVISEIEAEIQSKRQ